MNIVLANDATEPTIDSDHDVVEQLDLLACVAAAADDSPASVDEPSIDEYFTSLMQRVGMNPERVRAQDQVVEPTLKIAPAPEILEHRPQRAAATPAVSDLPQDELPRRAAPPERDKRAAMRDLAALSTHQLISLSNAKFAGKTCSELFVAVGALILAIALLAVSTGAVCHSYYGALVSLVVSVCFAVRFLRSIRVIDSFARGVAHG